MLSRTCFLLKQKTAYDITVSLKLRRVLFRERKSTRLFFFQAEDGIRDHCVTGVQTCALPISFHDATNQLEIRRTISTGISVIEFHRDRSSDFQLIGRVVKRSRQGGDSGALRDRKSVV